MSLHTFAEFRAARRPTFGYARRSRRPRRSRRYRPRHLVIAEFNLSSSASSSFAVQCGVQPQVGYSKSKFLLSSSARRPRRLVVRIVVIVAVSTVIAHVSFPRTLTTTCRPVNAVQSSTTCCRPCYHHRPRVTSSAFAVQSSPCFRGPRVVVAYSQPSFDDHVFSDFNAVQSSPRGLTKVLSSSLVCCHRPRFPTSSSQYSHPSLRCPRG